MAHVCQVRSDGDVPGHELAQEPPANAKPPPYLGQRICANRQDSPVNQISLINLILGYIDCPWSPMEDRLGKQKTSLSLSWVQERVIMMNKWEMICNTICLRRWRQGKWPCSEKLPSSQFPCWGVDWSDLHLWTIFRGQKIIFSEADHLVWGLCRGTRFLKRWHIYSWNQGQLRKLLTNVHPRDRRKNKNGCINQVNASTFHMVWRVSASDRPPDQ
jgi:hypothetical protein